MPDAGPPTINYAAVGDTTETGFIRVVFVSTTQTPTNWTVVGTPFTLPVVPRGTGFKLERDAGWWKIHFDLVPGAPAGSHAPRDLKNPAVRVWKRHISIVGISYH